ncbi:MAG: ATP-dependent Clp protease ATP-binding subunit ClpA, partial [Bosea sp. (in: a-proteobacteria)]
WLVENGYDEAMGARPMARLIQSTIKTPLADEVLFGRLKNGGAVKVVVVQSETGIKVLGLEFPDGPVKPKPEKDVARAAETRGRKPRARTAEPAEAGASGSGPGTASKPGGKGDGKPGGPSAAPKSARGSGSVPKVPLTKA